MAHIPMATPKGLSDQEEVDLPDRWRAAAQGFLQTSDQKDGDTVRGPVVPPLLGRAFQLSSIAIRAGPLEAEDVPLLCKVFFLFAAVFRS